LNLIHQRQINKKALNKVAFAERNCHSDPVLFQSTSIYQQAPVMEMDTNSGYSLYGLVYCWNVLFLGVIRFGRHLFKPSCGHRPMASSTKKWNPELPVFDG
jgi:hypothetical protein